jgi:hypothetical protein
MKKLLVLFVAMLSMSSIFGQNLISKVDSVATSTGNAISTVYNDTKNTIGTVYNDSKDAVEFLYPEVKSAVIAIAKGIGCGVEHVYTIIVKKFVVDGVADLIYFLILSGVLIYSCIAIGKYFKTHERIDWKCLISIVPFIISLTLLLNFNLSEMLICLINPEWKAIEFILETAKSLV